MFSSRFWKILLCPVIATLLLRQFRVLRQVNTFYYQRKLNIGDGPTFHRTPEQHSWSANDTDFVDLMATEYKDLHFTSIGERWRGGVRVQLMREERKRMYGVGPKTKKGEQIRKTFERLQKRLDDVDIAEIDDSSNWHKVTPQGYQETLQKARSSMDEMVEKVDTDCILWLLPNPKLTSLEVELDDRDDSKLQKNPESGPIIRFQCGNEIQTNSALQTEPCSSANLCLVKYDPISWASYYLDPSTMIKNDNQSNKTNEIDVSSAYNHTDLWQKFASPQEDATVRSSHSAILTMVDTIQYLRSGKKQGRELLGKSYFIWECFLNKASYAFRTKRDFYVWIGGFEGDKTDGTKNNDNTTTPTLHQRNTEVLSRTFGASCKPENEDKNVVHYYKPIAFGALFRKLRSQRAGGDDPKVWFVDADIFFNKEAFPGHNKNGKAPLSLDDYFSISPQASLLGSQNPSGTDDNILINGGLLGLRGSAIEPSNPLDDWVINLSALWWYCRCGERDQIALWLLLFATWSAESSGTNEEFIYPSLIFENYLFSWFGVFPQAQKLLPRLQKAWIEETKGPTNSRFPTAPTDATLLDGGKGFLTFSDSVLGASYSYPLELPHVLLLPLDPFVLPSDFGKNAGADSDGLSLSRSDFSLGVIRKNQPDKKALLTHTKNDRDVCYNFNCWPFLIRKRPKGVRVRLKKLRNEEKYGRQDDKMTKKKKKKRNKKKRIEDPNTKAGQSSIVDKLAATQQQALELDAIENEEMLEEDIENQEVLEEAEEEVDENQAIE